MKKYFTIPLVFLTLFTSGLGALIYKFQFERKQQQEKSISMEEYNRRVCNYNKPVLVFFHSDWCAICRKMGPSIGEIEKEFEGKLDVLRIDTERDKEVSDELEVNSLPLLILYKNGQKQWDHLGWLEKDAIRSKIGKL